MHVWLIASTRAASVAPVCSSWMACRATLFQYTTTLSAAKAGRLRKHNAVQSAIALIPEERTPIFVFRRIATNLKRAVLPLSQFPFCLRGRQAWAGFVAPVKNPTSDPGVYSEPCRPLHTLPLLSLLIYVGFSSTLLNRTLSSLLCSGLNVTCLTLPIASLVLYCITCPVSSRTPKGIRCPGCSTGTAPLANSPDKPETCGLPSIPLLQFSLSLPRQPALGGLFYRVKNPSSDLRNLFRSVKRREVSEFCEDRYWRTGSYSLASTPHHGVTVTTMVFDFTPYCCICIVYLPS